MVTVLETSVLVPSPVFLVELALVAAILVALVLGPLVGAVRRQQVVWAVVVVVVPLGGALWLLYGRRDVPSRSDGSPRRVAT